LSSGLGTTAAGKISCYGNGGGGGYSSAESSATINDGEWHHVVGVVRSDGYEIYVDGSSSGSTSISVGNTTGYNETSIGAWVNGGDRFVGSIDEPAVYSTALSAERIAAHYAARNNA
jgi:hypothetical protein